ncbi:MAG TPA: lipoprotein-releasing ABC transporter permease subunit [Caulobacteraceae bacterium]|nr:lipoprotein-releasing ABC transporter permease subunit [Caulobacteraceae bacterium]
MSPSAAGPFSGWERAIAGRYLRAKRKDGGVAIISIISFVGIMLAVAVLIIVMSVMNGFRSELLGRILGFNGHAYVGGPLLDDPLTRQKALDAIRKVPGVVQATPMVEAEALAQGPNNVTGAVVRGIGLSDLKATRIVSGNLKHGSLDGFGSGDYGGNLVLLGDRLADQLGVQVGDPVTLVSPNGASTAFGSVSAQKKTYTVGGIFSVGMSEYDQTFIYMPLPQAQLFFGRDQSVDVIEIMLDDPDKIAAIKPLIAQAAGPGSAVTDWRDKNQSFFNALQVERNTMRLILLLIVAIAAANIISGLVMLVKNKGRDIAILRTMGASRGAVLRIFFLAGATVGALGTVAGLVLGVLFCTFIEPIQKFVEWVTGADVFNADVYFLAHIPAKIDWSEVAFITLLSLAMSFLATLPPAWRASRLDPVEALRYE